MLVFPREQLENVKMTGSAKENYDDSNRSNVRGLKVNNDKNTTTHKSIRQIYQIGSIISTQTEVVTFSTGLHVKEVGKVSTDLQVGVIL